MLKYVPPKNLNRENSNVQILKVLFAKYLLPQIKNLTPKEDAILISLQKPNYQMQPK